MMPIYLFYSMFGFQRVGDLIWQAADARARGFLMGCTAGRTTMNGEGLQHEDGHSLLLASVVPTVHAYDAAFAYEMATIVERGIEHMFGPGAEDCIYYLTLYNENYPMPALPLPDADEATRAAAAAAVREGILRGIYRYAGPDEAAGAPGRSATLLFSGPSWQAAMQARELLASDWGVSTEAWSVTSYKALREDGLEVERWNRLHPESAPRVPYMTRASRGPGAPSSPSPIT